MRQLISTEERNGIVYNAKGDLEPGAALADSEFNAGGAEVGCGISFNTNGTITELNGASSAWVDTTIGVPVWGTSIYGSGADNYEISWTVPVLDGETTDTTIPGGFPGAGNSLYAPTALSGYVSFPAVFTIESIAAERL